MQPGEVPFEAVIERIKPGRRSPGPSPLTVQRQECARLTARGVSDAEACRIMGVNGRTGQAAWARCPDPDGGELPYRAKALAEGDNALFLGKGIGLISGEEFSAATQGESGLADFGRSADGTQKSFELLSTRPVPAGVDDRPLGGPPRRRARWSAAPDAPPDLASPLPRAREGHGCPSTASRHSGLVECAPDRGLASARQFSELPQRSARLVLRGHEGEQGSALCSLAHNVGIHELRQHLKRRPSWIGHAQHSAASVATGRWLARFQY